MAENTKRGLGSADEQKREDVARKGGEATSKDREHVAGIGKKGSEARYGKGSNEQVGGAGKSSDTRNGSKEQQSKPNVYGQKKAY